tara:strand:- start:5294 stop:5455 length:162 start_codon:yes stop_codon:yes gene_type:complete
MRRIALIVKISLLPVKRKMVFLAKRAIIKSDEHKLYPRFVKKYFPKSEHLRFK